MSAVERDVGSAVLETVLVTPLLLLLLAAIVGAGRVTLAHQRVDDAAAQAARAAAAAASPARAQAAATATASQTMDHKSLDCVRMTVDVDITEFRPGGYVSVRVACLADLGVGVPTLSGRRWLDAEVTEVLDFFAEVHS